MGRLDDEIAIVTGSTSGLGREIARVFAVEGARVVVTGRSAERGQAVAAKIRSEGGEAVFIPCDLSREADCQSLVETAAQQFGSVTVLVNNAVSPAAIARDGTVATTDVSVWREMFEVNLLSVAILCRSPRTARRLAPLFAAHVPTRIVFDGRFLPRGPVQITTVDEVRGLEFDLVIVPDANAGMYPDDAASRRTMYVAVTRARHQVAVARVGERSPCVPWPLPLEPSLPT